MIPFGDNKRYDFVTEELGKFIRYQCKTGRLRDGRIIFNVVSVNRSKGSFKVTHYHDQIDNFVVYCPELDKVYVIPIKDTPKSGTNMMLRVDVAKNGQTYKTSNWAKDYEI